MESQELLNQCFEKLKYASMSRTPSTIIPRRRHIMAYPCSNQETPNCGRSNTFDKEKERLFVKQTCGPFTRTLKEAFKDVGRQDDAIYRLHNTKQGDSTVDDFNTKFRINVQIASLNEQENATLLIAAYTQNLDARIGEAIIMQGAPATLSDWMV